MLVSLFNCIYIKSSIIFSGR